MSSARLPTVVFVCFSLTASAPLSADRWVVSCCGLVKVQPNTSEVSTRVAESSSRYVGTGAGVNIWSHSNRIYSGDGMTPSLPGTEVAGNDPYDGMWVDCRRNNGCGATATIPNCVGGVPNYFLPYAVSIIVRFGRTPQAFESWGSRHTDTVQQSCQHMEEPPEQENPDTGDTCPECSPLVLDLDGRGFRFTGLEHAAVFDLDADGEQDVVSWTDWGDDDGFLVLDRNGNGIIDDGTELFGTATPLADGSPAENGFEALRVLDGVEQGGDGDGTLSNVDEAFRDLRVWADFNRNGYSEEWELSTLEERGIVRIELAYRENRRRDRNGNLLRFNGRYVVQTETAERPFKVTDVFFLKR